MRYMVEDLRGNPEACGYVDMMRDWIVKSGRASAVG
jgi:hypothetical protein